MKFSKLFFLLFFLFNFTIFYSKKIAAETIVQNIQNSNLILTAKVEKIEKWKNRDDLQIVTIRPLQVFKGLVNAPTIQFLHQKLFPNLPSSFRTSQELLLFLKPLPSYTAWQGMIKAGIKFELTGKSRSFFDSTEEKKIISSFIHDFLKLESSTKNQESFKEFYLSTLQNSSSKILQQDLVSDFFGFDQKYEPQGKPAKPDSAANRGIFNRRVPEGDKKAPTSKELAILSKLVLSEQIDNETKEKIVKNLTQYRSVEVQSLLKKFFCISPEPVCLLSAEGLESQEVSIPLSEYSKTFKTASSSLQVGLLQILARHQRKEAIPLFEKALSKEQDPHKAASMIEALGEMRGVESEMLCLKYARDSRYYVRIAVVRSLGKLKSIKGISVLEVALKSGDPSMINVAAKSLEQIGTQEAQRTLEKYYERTPHGFLEPAGPEHFNLPK